MAFFDDLTKKLSTAADIAVDKAKDLAETGKLKLDIATEEKEVQKLYAQIGKAIYQQEKDNPDSIFAAECYNITERLQRIEELKTEAPAEEPVVEASVDPTYITNYAGARNIISRIEREELLKDIIETYLN